MPADMIAITRAYERHSSIGMISGMRGSRCAHTPISRARNNHCSMHHCQPLISYPQCVGCTRAAQTITRTAPPMTRRGGHNNGPAVYLRTTACINHTTQYHCVPMSDTQVVILGESICMRMRRRVITHYVVRVSARRYTLASEM